MIKSSGTGSVFLMPCFVALVNSPNYPPTRVCVNLSNRNNATDLFCRGLWDLLMETFQQRWNITIIRNPNSLESAPAANSATLKHPEFFNNSSVKTFHDTLKNSRCTTSHFNCIQETQLLTAKMAKDNELTARSLDKHQRRKARSAHAAESGQTEHRGAQGWASAVRLINPGLVRARSRNGLGRLTAELPAGHLAWTPASLRPRLTLLLPKNNHCSDNRALMWCRVDYPICCLCPNSKKCQRAFQIHLLSPERTISLFILILTTAHHLFPRYFTWGVACQSRRSKRLLCMCTGPPHQLHEGLLITPPWRTVSIAGHSEAKQQPMRCALW